MGIELVIVTQKENMNKQKKKIGAPKQLKDGKARNTWMDSATSEKAEKIGQGSVSAGIRIAVEAYKLKVQK